MKLITIAALAVLASGCSTISDWASENHKTVLKAAEAVTVARITNCIRDPNLYPISVCENARSDLTAIRMQLAIINDTPLPEPAGLTN